MWWKILSARFLATVGVIFTFCTIIIMVVSAILTLLTAGFDIPAGARELIGLLIGAFISTVSTITTFYFMRTDRTTPTTETESGK